MARPLPERFDGGRRCLHRLISPFGFLPVRPAPAHTGLEVDLRGLALDCVGDFLGRRLRVCPAESISPLPPNGKNNRITLLVRPPPLGGSGLRRPFSRHRSVGGLRYRHGGETASGARPRLFPPARGQGGKIGGKIAAANSTAAERTARATKASHAAAAARTKKAKTNKAKG